MNTELQENSRTSFIKEYRHILFSAIGWLIYIALFFALKKFIEPKHFIHCRLDDLIPFVKWFFIPYCMWYVYLFGAVFYFALTDKAHFFKLHLHLFLGLGICLLVYVVYPNAIQFRPLVSGQGFLTSIMASMYTLDKPTMVTPSMHVFASIAVHTSIVKGQRTGKNKLLVSLSFLIMVLICVSTVLVKQHSAIDVLWGAVLAVLLFFPVYRFEK